MTAQVQSQAQFLDYQQFLKSPANAQLAGIAVLQGVTKALAKNGREYLRCSLVLAPSGDIESSVTISGISFVIRWCLLLRRNITGVLCW